MKLNKPNVKPNNPNFSSGPTTKRPGWTTKYLEFALLGRSHRSPDCKARLKKVIEKLEQNLLINAGIYLIDPKIKKIIKNSEYLDMTDLINRALNKKLKINVFPIHEEWLDYGLNKNKIK